MSALKTTAISLATTAGLLAALPLVLPYNKLIEPLSNTLARRLEVPVKIEQIEFNYLPAPALVVNNVTLGDSGDATINRITVPASLQNIFGFSRALNNISVEGGQFKQSFVMTVPQRLRKNAAAIINFGKIRFSDCNVKLDKGLIGPLAGNLQLNRDGSFKEITLTDKSERAQLNLKPLGSNYIVDFQAKNWVMPGDNPIQLDSLIMRGLAGGNGADIDDLQLQVFGGVAVGTAQLRWGDVWQVAGNLSTKSMQAEPLIAHYSETTRATGRLAGVAQFSAVADSHLTLGKNPQIDLKFTISDGMLHNIDLITLLKSQSATSLTRGGQTRFDQLSGNASINSHQVRISNLHLDGGKFSANGGLVIGDKEKLSGQLSARLKSGAIEVNSQLNLSGTLDSPTISSGGASRAGAGGTAQIF